MTGLAYPDARDDEGQSPDAPSEDHLLAAVIGHAAESIGEAAHALQAVAALLSRRADAAVAATRAIPRPAREPAEPVTLGPRT